ncbi:MAG TPA: hypothetical protein PKC40_08095 [Saprospiraceae bacterium]|nr:hypothetical protein [Saprospiraceae bacterium]
MDEKTIFKKARMDPCGGENKSFCPHGENSLQNTKPKQENIKSKVAICHHFKTSFRQVESSFQICAAVL